MQSFLEKVVKHIHSRYGDELSDLCIVLPNRRAGLFLKTQLAKVLHKTFWAPEIVAIEDFVTLLSELEPVDNITLLFELYETVKKVNPQQTESFDEFSKWGQVALADFNDIDRYLVDAKQLFGNLKNIKELESWSLNAEPLTEFQQQYLRFWQSLGGYYFDFKERLLSKRTAYQGLANRVVAENLSEKIKGHHWKKIIFVGFNALNKAEEKIIEALLNSNQAEIIWDVDSYYINNSKQEAGLFFRKYRDKNLILTTAAIHNSKSIVIEEDLLSKEEKHIHIIGASKNVAQAKYAGNLIHQLQKEHPDLKNTALVLADENLLFPVLHSLPPELKDINVTMGFPLNNTPFAGYVELFFQLHNNAKKLAQGKSKYSYYYQDLLNLLNHPYTNLLLNNSNSNKEVKAFVREIHEKNILFISATTIEKRFANEWNISAKLNPLFDYWQVPEDALSSLNFLINNIKDAIVEQQEGKSSTSLDLEYLFAFTKISKRLGALVKEYPNSIVDLKTLFGLIKQIVKSTSLPFYGEPLMGLQVMGMLETRTLDFENIILLSCNENILPAGKAANTFVPYELKKHFGLPVYSDKDAIFAYHFYRLLQRAKNVYLIYNTETELFGTAEKSRFLTQLIHELPKVNPNVKIEERLFSIPVEVKAPGNVISVAKTDKIIEKLNQKAEHGFSPSALNLYINCSLQFYFQVIAELRETKEVEETIGADVLGKVIHKALEILYYPFVGKIIKATDVKEFKKEVVTLVNKGFENEYGINDTNFGKNLLIKKIAVKFLNNFLDKEIEQLTDGEKAGIYLTIKKLEEPLETKLIISNQSIKFHGNADRIDMMGNTLRIIDYKTGVVNDAALKIHEAGQLLTDASLSKSFQLLMYAWMYQKMNPETTGNLISGIITFRELSKGFKTVKVNKEELLHSETLKLFEEQLTLITSEILNADSYFSQTDNKDNCLYCSYRGICGR